MATKAKDGYGFVIQTNEYTGNFEREMCAFVTGQTGECGVGEEFVDEAITEQFDNVMCVADDHGCHRPVSLHDKNNNDLVIFFEEKPTKKQIALMKERSELFNEAFKNEGEWHKNSNIKILGFKLECYERKIKTIKL
jgi:hypothetical protein